MKLKPLEQWYCDKCGEVVENPGNDVLQWIVGTGELSYGYKILHFKECEYKTDDLDSNERTQDMHLEQVLGESGMVRLLNFFKSNKLRNPEEILEVFHRLQVPYYEEARTYYSQAVEDGFIESRDDYVNKLPERAVEIIRNYSR